MQPIHVRDPDEMPWVVGVPILPWRPRWRGPMPGRRSTVDETVAEAGTHLGVEAGGEVGGAVLGSVFEDGPGALVIVAGFAIAAVLLPVLVFAFALAIEVALVVAVAGLVLAGRILLRRPFAVVAVAADGRRREWRVRGLGAARAWAPRAADAIRAGIDPPPG